ncbi:MAG TPA: hypothetical protein VGI70_07945 [Polyangiales bacterium]
MRYFARVIADRRGTASIEAAVMLPVMALCWAGLFLRFQGLESILDAAVESRRDAWVFSGAGCEMDGDVPPGIVVHCLPSSAGWMQTVSKLPLVGWLIGTVAGYDLTKTATRDHSAPKLLGGRSSRVAYPYFLSCNEKSRDASYVLKAVICEQVSNMGLSLDFAVDCPKKPARGDDSCDE